MIMHGAVADISKEHADLMANAIYAGDRVAVDDMLDNGFPVDAGLYDGMYTPLYLAAAQSDVAICELLLRRGANIEPQTSYRMTVLGHVVGNISRRSVHEVCDLLLRAGANPNAVNGWGYTALHQLAEVSNDIANQPSSHPLGPASLRQKEVVKVAQMLARAGASPSHAPAAPHPRYRTPMQLAAERGCAELVRYFLEECNEDPNQRTHSGRTLLQIAKSPSVREAIYSARAATSLVEPVQGPALPPDGEPALARRAAPGML